MTLCLGLVLLVLVLHQPRVLAAPSPPSCLCLVSWTPGLAVDPNNFAEAQRVDNYSGNFIPRNVTATLCGASSFPTNSQQCERMRVPSCAAAAAANSVVLLLFI